MLNKKGNVHINKEIVMREEDDGAFLFNPDTGRICYLNELGVSMWKLCEKPKTPEQLIGTVHSEYPDVPKDQISNDCMKFLDDLQGLGCLSIAYEE